MRLLRHKNKRHTKKAKRQKSPLNARTFFCLSDNIRCRFIKDDVALSVIFETY